jgi:hypothetical protein
MVMKRIFVILAALFFVLQLHAQYNHDYSKLALHYQTYSKGLINYDSLPPSHEPVDQFDTYAYVDTMANIMYLWDEVQSAWKANNIIESTTPPLDTSYSGGQTIIRSSGIWFNSTNTQFYLYNYTLDAWAPALGIYYAPTTPANIAATGSASAVNYHRSLWYNESDNLLYRYNSVSAAWVEMSGGSGTDNQTAAEVSVTKDGYITEINAQDAIVQASRERVPVILFWGESNSGGQAVNDSLDAGQLDVFPGIQIYNIYYDEFQDLDIGTNNQINHFGQSFPASMDSIELTLHGWENGLQTDYERYGQAKLYLVKGGQGGSRISQWETTDTFTVLLKEKNSQCPKFVEG